MKKTTILICALCLSPFVSGKEDTQQETTKKTITFEYDGAGNRTVRKAEEEQPTASEDAKNAPTSSEKSAENS